MSSKLPSSESKVDFLSEYNLRGIIGKGTFSIVKLGEHKKTKEKVAIKILQKNKILNQEDLIRIQREIEILKSLKHPNIIKIHRIGEDDKRFYIIMEFCENGELFNRIVERQHLTEDEAALFYYQLINGLEYIHKNNIVHRDLKPENLLLSKNDLLKIIDFGLSNFTGYNILLGTPCGSPCYASPEMVSGQRYNGYMIDVWSTGIILFAMVNGYLPFEDNNNEILFGKILKCKINYPQTMGKLTLDLMKKIVVPDPKKRITLEQIKQHPFYLKGKTLFNKKYPELIEEINGNKNIDNNINTNSNIDNINNNLKIKEILVKNVTPIVKNKIIKNIKENKENNSNNINKNLNIINNNNNKYYRLKLNDINNIYQPYAATEINSPIPINITNLDNSKIKPKINSNTKEILSQRDYKLDSPSSLQSDEIPKDSEPIKISGEKNRNLKNIKNKEEKNDIKKNLKEEMNTINLTGQNNLRAYKIYKINSKNQNKKIPTKEKEIKEQLQKVAKNIGEKIYVSKTRTKEKDRKKLNNVNYATSPINKINDKKIENLYKKEKMNSTLDNDNAITNIAAKMDYYNINENPKNKISRINNKIEKNSYLNNTVNQADEDKTKDIINSKIAKMTSALTKRIQRKQIYVMNNKNENNNIKLNNIVNPNMIKLNSRINKYSYDVHNNTVNETTNDNNIFNELNLIQGEKKLLNKDNIINNTINTLNTYNNTININDRNTTRQLIIGKTFETATSKIPRKEPDNNKEIYKYNNYINKRENINLNSDRHYYNAIKNKNLSMNHDQKNKRINNQITNNKLYISNNTTNFQGVSPMNDKFFDTITINNNNNINLHEPKLYIYVQNNNANNNINNINNQRLKTDSNQNRTKTIFKLENKNSTNSINNNKNVNNKINSVEYAKIIPTKRINTNIIDNKTLESDLNMKRIHKITPIKNSQTFHNKNININSNEKFLVSKKIYNSIDNNRNVYTSRTNDIVFNNTKKHKDNNMVYISNKKNNNNIYIDNNYNSINKTLETDSNIIIKPANNFNNFTSIDKSNEIYRKMHNIVKTDGNMDVWSYDKERIFNDNNIMENNFINNQRTVRISNINNYNNNNFDKIDYKKKLEKLQMKNYINNINKDNNNKNMNYIIPNESNTIDISNNYRRINPISNNFFKTPDSKQDYKNLINYKLYKKHY